MRKRKFCKKIIVLIMFIATISLLSCSKEVRKEKKQDKDTLANLKQEGYQTFFQEIDIKSTQIEHICECDNKIYMIGTYYQQKKKTNKSILHTYLLEYTINEKESNIKETELKLNKKESIQAITVDEKKQIHILTYIVSLHKKEQKSEKNNYYIKLLKPDGSIKKEHKLQWNDKQELFMDSRKTLLKQDGSVYTSNFSNFIYSFDATGKQGKTYDMKKTIDTIIETEDGNVYVYGNFGINNEYAFKKLDISAQKFGDPINIDQYEILDAEAYSGKDGLIYMKNQDGLYSIDTIKETGTLLFQWINQNIDGQTISKILPFKNGNILVVLKDSNSESGKLKLAIIKKGTAKETKEKTVLTLACTSPFGNLKEIILKFNQSNEDYQIELKDYSSYEDSITKLNLELVSGTVPDILSLNMLPTDMYIKKGILTDLYPLIAKDKELKKENFLDSVINTLEQDGKLYYLNSSFTINALTGGKKYLKDTSEWNFQKMKELYENKSEQQVFFMEKPREAVLGEFLLGMIDNLIDWNTGEVFMDSENFIHMLEFLENFPSMAEMKPSNLDLGEAVKKGNVIMMDSNFNFPSSIELFTELYKEEGEFHIVSYPSENKNNKLVMSFSNPALAITEQCKDKEGAWEFLRQVLTYEYQIKEGLSYGFPIRKDAFKKSLEYAMATKEYIDENNIIVKPIEGSTNYSGYKITYRPLLKEEAEQLQDMVDRIGFIGIERGDVVVNNIMNIIKEEANVFYSGDRTIEETVEIIQNKVKLFVSENS